MVNTKCSSKPDTDNPFKQFERIDEAKDVQARDETILEALLRISEQVINSVSINQQDTQILSSEYIALYNRLKEGELGLVQFTEDDLTQFILTGVNNDYDKSRAMILGLYTSCLLQLLTERRAQKGERTRFYINGKGNKFDYLFFMANHIDDLIVENFKGKQICSYIGSYEGHAGKIIGINLEGEHALVAIGYHGNVKQLIGIAIKGDYALSRCGYKHGNVNQIIAADLTGMGVLTHIASMFGKVNQLVCVRIIPNPIIESYSRVGGHINQFVYYNVSEVPSLSCKKNKDYNLDGVTKFIELTAPHKDEKTTLSGDDVEKDSSQSVSQPDTISSEHEARNLIQLADSLRGKPYQEVLRIADKLYALRPAVPEGFFEGK